MMRGILVAIVLAGGLIATAATAQQKPVTAGKARFGDPTSTARIYQDYLYGVIKNIDANAMVLEKTKFGIDQTFKFDRKVKFIQDGKPSSLDQLKVGDKVWVDVKKDKKTGELIAKKVVTGMAVTQAP
jgi:hypothetical protein